MADTGHYGSAFERSRPNLGRARPELTRTSLTFARKDQTEAMPAEFGQIWRSSMPVGIQGRGRNHDSGRSRTLHLGEWRMLQALMRDSGDPRHPLRSGSTRRATPLRHGSASPTTCLSQSKSDIRSRVGATSCAARRPQATPRRQGVHFRNATNDEYARFLGRLPAHRKRTRTSTPKPKASAHMQNPGDAHWVEVV